MAHLNNIIYFMENKCMPVFFTPMNTDTRIENERKVMRLEEKNGINVNNNSNNIINNTLLNNYNDIMNIINTGMFITNVININPDIEPNLNYQFEDVPTPLSNADIQTLTVKRFEELTIDDIKRSEIDTDCPICKMEYEPNSEITILPCEGRHYYHTECINEWIEMSKKCPICKVDIEDAIHS